MVNSSGTVVEAHDYYPFGLLMPGRDYQTAERTKELFTGKERDDETELDYFGARYYWSAGGRWWSVDPALNKWTIQKIANHGLFSLSPYSFVKNDPVNRFDPNGYVDWKRVGLGALGIVSGAFETGLGGTIATGGSVTIVGAVGGTALMIHGLSTIGFGSAEMLAGFSEAAQEIPGGPLEAVGEVAEQGTGVEGLSEIGKTADLGVQVVSGGNPVKGITKAGNLIPLSAKEASQAGNYQIKVAKELVNVVSQASSAAQLEETAEEIVETVKKKDDENNEQ